MRVARAVPLLRVGRIMPGNVTTEHTNHNDWVSTLCSMVGEPGIRARDGELKPH
jgi:arylsulfatase A-like enzyme